MAKVHSISQCVSNEDPQFRKQVLTDDHEREFEASFDAFAVDLVGEVGESHVAVELLHAFPMFVSSVAAATAVDSLRGFVTIHHVVIRSQLVRFAARKKC